jgi:excisionase family DNA binding protein
VTTNQSAANELLTVEEVAEALRVDDATVRRWIADGRLAGVRLGPKLLRVKASDLATFLEASAS